MFWLKSASFLLIFHIGVLYADPSEKFDDIIEQIVPRNEISNAQLRNLRDELKIQNMFIEGVKGIEISGGDFKNISKATNTIEELIVSSFEAKSSSLPSHLKAVFKQTVKDSISSNAIERTLIKAKDFVFKHAGGRKVMMTSVARRWGFDVGLVYLLTMQVDFTFPTIMIAMGNMEFAPLLATPLASTTTGAYATLKSAVRMKHLVKSLGGLASVRRQFDVYRKVKEFFRADLLKKHDIIDIDVAGRNFTFTMEKQNMLTRFKQRLGWNKNLNYQNLADFLESNNFLGDAVRNVANSNRPEEVKLLKLLYRIELEDDLELISKLKSKFGDFIQEMDNLPEFSQGRQWAARISNAQTFDEFGRLMMNIPDDIPPRVFDRIWRNHILPRASKNVGPFVDKDTYKAFRSMENNWSRDFRKVMTESADLTLDDHWKSRLADYFFESLAPVNGCGAIFTPRGQFAPLL